MSCPAGEPLASGPRGELRTDEHVAKDEAAVTDKQDIIGERTKDAKDEEGLRRDIGQSSI